MAPAHTGPQGAPVTGRLAAVLAAAALAGPAVCPAQTAGGRESRLDRGIARAVEFLRGRIGDEGACKREFPGSDRQHGGMTALCAYALASAGVPATDPVLRKAMRWLEKAELKSTYAVSLRACAAAALKERRYLPLVKKDVAWLVGAANSRGGYTYQSQGGRDTATYDNSNTHVALLGVAAGMQLGAKVPASYWRLMARHWVATQQADGGWGYTRARGPLRAKTYGSMTAAGVASLYLCLDNIAAGDLPAPGPANPPPQYKSISAGLRWLREHYSALQNPRLGRNRYYYWMCCLARVALAGGKRTIAGHDWYAEGAAALLSRQHDDGSWGFGHPVRQTCFALLFLARSRQGILFHKLEYPGRWNTRPRDLANLTKWLSYNFERPVGWQVIGFDAGAGHWDEAPILYMSGAGPFELTDAQVDKLRTFVLRGGMMLSEAAGNNADFTLEMRKLYKRMFPRFPLRRLADEHPIYRLHFKPKVDRGLAGVSNGARLLAVHCPREVSLGLQVGPDRGNRPLFELGANLAFFATDRALPRTRGQRSWPVAKKFKPAATVRVARLRYKGNYDPEPLAWRRLAILMGNRHRIRLEVSPPVAIAALDPSRWPVAAMTGTASFALTAGEAAALTKYLTGGGMLVVDAAGGSHEFAEAVEKHILPLAPGGRAGPIAPEHPIFRGVAKVGPVRYRRAMAAVLGEARHRPRLQGVERGGRLVIVFSRDDLTEGLLAAACHGLRGYAPQTAVGLMTNIVCHAAGVNRPGSAK